MKSETECENPRRGIYRERIKSFHADLAEVFSEHNAANFLACEQDPKWGIGHRGRSASGELGAPPGLNAIRTHALCNAGAVLYQMSYQANWELVMSP